MKEESVDKRVLYLREVEKLSGRQIATQLGISERRTQKILKGLDVKPLPRGSLVDPYRNLIEEWYRQYPKLKAIQIYERLKSYGYEGGYTTVTEWTKKYREAKKEAYHPLTFLPGEEAQIDWFFFKDDTVGAVAGFVYVLSYSRYAWGKFYPKTSFEFFLDGHLECFKHLKGLAHKHRYDNLRSVVLKREPVIEYNGQFLDFSRHYGFAIHACNPYSGNEKGRVERLIRDVRVFLYGQTFTDLNDLNRKFQDWLTLRNERIHRTTGQTPKELLLKERLLALPKLSYPPTRTIPAVVSKTALVEFDTNRYSVPSGCVSKSAEIVASPERIEVWVNSSKVATHRRSFKRKQVIQNPLHAERLLDRSPHFKYERMLTLFKNMDPAFAQFLSEQPTHEEALQAAHGLFCLFKTYSTPLLTSAVRELNQMRSFKIKALRSLLNLPEPKEASLLWPQDSKLLNLDYQPRRLQDYDPPNC
jgi:transposase